MTSYYALALFSMLAFFISCGSALDDNVLQTTLYIKQSFTQDQRAGGTDIAIINWPIKDGSGAAANTIGHAEGLAVYANQAKPFWVTIMDMVFEGGSLSGSSLKVMGLHGSKNDEFGGQGQWSVMGGTGELIMARGIINYNITQQDSASRTFEICLFVFYTPMETILASGDTGRNP